MPRETPDASPAVGVGVAALSWLGATLFVQTILETPELSLAFFSAERWQGVVSAIGGRVSTDAFGQSGTVPFMSVGGLLLVLAFIVAAVGAVAGRAAGAFMGLLIRNVVQVGKAWLPAGVWWLLWMVAVLSEWSNLAAVLRETADLTAAGCLALMAFRVWPGQKPGFSKVAGLLSARSSDDSATPNRSPRATLAAGMIVYVLVFTAMNWGLWFNLRLPHGDSAMYEEHLWNLEHGKGFRSYLDQGLFLGEHLQVVHLLLVPLHAVFPSQLTLELVQSVILALGAWPVYNIARRHSRSEWAAALLGLAYLAYFPLQYLDIAIDLKTFRPNSFGIPTLLVAIDLLERRQYGWATLWLAVTLSAQEDWAIPIALVGLWLVFAGRSVCATDADRRRQVCWGIGLFIFSVIYLWFALNVAIPWFRSGATVHTASYFSKFGISPREIVVTLLTNPTLLYSTIATPAALVYALRLLMPIGFLPLWSAGRLLVAAPLFLLLLMNDLAMQVPAPVHHFHALLIPILFWAAAAGLGSAGNHKSAQDRRQILA